MLNTGAMLAVLTTITLNDYYTDQIHENRRKLHTYAESMERIGDNVSIWGHTITTTLKKVIRMALCIVSLGWLVVLINLIPNRKLFCTGIGQRTMTVYICHIPIRYLIEEMNLPGDGNVFTYVLSFGLAIISICIFSRPVLHTAYHAIIDFLYDKICARIFSMGNAVCSRTVGIGQKMVHKVYRNQ